MFRYLKFYIFPAAIMLVAFSMLFGGVWLWLPGVSLVFISFCFG
ncbi:hypothetical protein HNQ57_003466 [Zhongshania antarctica]|uniref:Uncharacterized protein n=1 Tax=Zhongshania antarctica TaxID=641702 RepID=A0A840R9R3_9GAMM|nr:hypothetical protein [Zhongshania antarctica]